MSRYPLETLEDIAALEAANERLLNALDSCAKENARLREALEFCGRCASADLDPDPYSSGAERLEAIENRARAALKGAA